MANRPLLTEAQCRLVRKRERVHRKTSAKATAALLGVSYRIVRRVLEGSYLTREQWEITLESTAEAKRRRASAQYFNDKRMKQSRRSARVVG